MQTLIKWRINIAFSNKQKSNPMKCSHPNSVIHRQIIQWRIDIQSNDRDINLQVVIQSNELRHSIKWHWKDMQTSNQMTKRHQSRDKQTTSPMICRHPIKWQRDINPKQADNQSNGLQTSKFCETQISNPVPFWQINDIYISNQMTIWNQSGHKQTSNSICWHLNL